MRALRPIIFLASASLAIGQPPPPPLAPASNAPHAISEIEPGVFALGGIRLEQKTRSVSFPAAINMAEGALEYLLVGKNGPTHESLLVTDIRAEDLHTLMLLLGAKGAPTRPGEAAPSGPLTHEYLEHAPKLTGQNVQITATWKNAAHEEKTTEVSDWLAFESTHSAASRGPWLYTGSSFGTDGKFAAQVEDVFAALVTNPAALINNPRAGNDDDRLWSVNEKAVPPAKTPLRITIQLAAGVER